MIITDSELTHLSQQTGAALTACGATLASAESCTGGWIAKALTDIPGSSGWFCWGFVTYSNQAKQQMLGVDAITLERHGAVSEAVVRQMAQAARTRANAHYAIAVSGIAGPDGGSADKPVGTVWFAVASEQGDTLAWRQQFAGDRDAVRRQAVAFALRTVCQQITQKA